MRGKILIAEGDAALRGLYRHALARGGLEAETVSNGLDCLEVLRQKTPAALVLDLDLIWGGGEGILAWLREEGRKSSPPVILTARPNFAGNGALFHEPPVVAWLHKPITPWELLQNVQAAIPQLQNASEVEKSSDSLCRYGREFPGRVFGRLIWEAETACQRLSYRPIREIGGWI